MIEDSRLLMNIDTVTWESNIQETIKLICRFSGSSPQTVTFYFASLTGSVLFRLDSASPPNVQTATTSHRPPPPESPDQWNEHTRASPSLPLSSSLPLCLSVSLPLSPSVAPSLSKLLDTFTRGRCALWILFLWTLKTWSSLIRTVFCEPVRGENDPAGGPAAAAVKTCESSNIHVQLFSSSAPLTRLCAPLSSRSLRVFSSSWDIWMWNIQSELWLLWFLLKSAGTSRTSSCRAPPGWSAAARRFRSVFILRTDEFNSSWTRTSPQLLSVKFTSQ